MQNELIKQFVKKTLRRIVIFVVIMLLVTALSSAMAPIISNEVALGQMQHSNEMFVLMETYNKIKPLFTAAYAAITIWFVYTLGRDTYKLVKTINTKNEKENK